MESRQGSIKVTAEFAKNGASEGLTVIYKRE